MRGGGEGCRDVHFRPGIGAALAQVRDGGQQRLGVRVLRVVEDLAAVPVSTIRPRRMTAIRSARSATTPMSWVMRMIALSSLFAQVAHEVGDFGLHGHVQGGGGLVGDQQLWVAGERLRDHRALPLAAGKLVGVGPKAFSGSGSSTRSSMRRARRRASSGTCCAAGPSPRSAPHRVDRVQGRHGLLEDHGDFLTADRADVRRVSQQLLAGELDARRIPGCCWAAGPEGHGTGALARAGLAHDGEHLTGADLVVQADRRRHPLFVHAEVDTEVADLQYGLASSRRGGAGGSRVM